MTTTDSYTVGIAIAAFVGILALLLVLRAINSQWEVRPADIAVSILPVVIFLLVTGKIQKFEVGDLRIETAFVNASTSAITPQVTPLIGLPSEPIQIDAKRGVEDIPRLIAKKTQGLLFRLGDGSYYGPAIRQYLVLLSKQPFLRYLILEHPNRTFFGMADARALAELLASEHPPYTADEVARWLAASDTAALKRLPGFIASDSAVTETTDKAQALQDMESLNIDTLPVINQGKHFVGIVNRSRVTASLILDVAKALKQ
jgi:hypothetical protein